MQSSRKPNNYPLPFFFLLLLVGLTLNAQEIRENEQGEKIIVYPDGRVEYFNGDPVPPEAQGTTEAYPVFDGYIEPLDGSITVNEEDLFKIALRRAQLAEEAAGIAEVRAEEAQANLSRLQGLQPANQEENRQLQKQLEAAFLAAEQTRVEAQEARLLAMNTQEVTEKGGYVEDFNTRRQNNRRTEERSDIIRQAADQPYTQLIPLTDNAIATSREDLIRRPPSGNCSFEFEGNDDRSGQYRRDLEQQLLFTYTDERLRPFLKEKEYLSCEGFLSSVGGYRFLTLEFTFAYPNAREAYGFIDQNSILTVKLLNGDFVNLRAGQMDRGSYDTIREELKYRVYYPIDRGQISILKQGEVDLLRVFWSSGYEEYEVYQLDFFQRQFECLGD